MHILSFLDISFDTARFCVFDFKKMQILFAEEVQTQPNLIREITFGAKNASFNEFILLLDKAEKKLNMIIVDVVFLFKNSSLKVEKTHISTELNKPRRISKKDIEDLENETLRHLKAEILEEDIFLSMIPTGYFVDGRSFMPEEKTFGKKINLSILYSHVKRSSVESFIDRCEECKIRIKNFVAPDYCYLLNNQKKSTIFIDFGAYFTSFCMYDKNEDTLYRDCINFGSFDVSSDLMKTFDISYQDAEFLKMNIDNIVKKDKDYEIILEDGRKKIKSSYIAKVCEARFNEIITFIQKNLSRNNIKPNNISMFWKNYQCDLLKNTAEQILNCNTEVPKVNYHNIQSFKIESKENFDQIMTAIEFYKNYITKYTELQKRTEDGHFLDGKISCFLKKIFY